MWGDVRREIDAYVPRALRARVVSDALALAGLRAAPRDARSLWEFVTGPLFLSLAAVCGPDDANAICARISARLRTTAQPPPPDIVHGAGVERATGVRLASVAARSARGGPYGRATLRPRTHVTDAVAFFGPDAAGASLGRFLPRVGARLLAPGAGETPDLLVVCGRDLAVLDLAARSRDRWPGVGVLAWCVALVGVVAPAGIEVVPLPEQSAEEVARVCRAHLDARSGR